MAQEEKQLLLKANELMIGDWVLDKMENVPVRVTAIEGDGVRQLYGKMYDGDFAAIKLTSKILEKNGFKDVSVHTLKESEVYQLSFGKYNDQRLIYKSGNYFAFEAYDHTWSRWLRLFDTHFCHNWNVHELQHALRLCQIDKTIEL